MDDRSNYICPHCSYEAPGASTYRFHITRICGRDAELARLIADQQKDMRSFDWHDPRVASLDKPVRWKNRNRVESLLDLTPAS